MMRITTPAEREVMAVVKFSTPLRAVFVCFRHAEVVLFSQQRRNISLSYRSVLPETTKDIFHEQSALIRCDSLHWLQSMRASMR
jgi:hypothetical protein